MKPFSKAILILSIASSSQTFAMTNIEKCTKTAEILKIATVDIANADNMSLAEYEKSEGGKLAAKFSSEERGENAVAATYKIARAMNDEAISTAKLAMAILDKNKVKYERSKILAKSFDNMLQKIEDQSASCVLNENAYKAKKKEASQKATLPTI